MVPSFNHWRFPHGDLPDLWGDTFLPTFTWDERNDDAVILARDGGICRMTGYTQKCSITHIVPRRESDWFNSNRMIEYVLRFLSSSLKYLLITECTTNTFLISSYCVEREAESPVDDSRNRLAMYRDVDDLFLKRNLTFVAKRLRTGPPALACYVLDPLGSVEVLNWFHNKMPHQPYMDVANEFMFARFAWAIFNGSVPRLNGALPWNLQLWDGNRRMIQVQPTGHLGLLFVRNMLLLKPKEHASGDGDDARLGEPSSSGVTGDGSNSGNYHLHFGGPILASLPGPRSNPRLSNPVGSESSSSTNGRGLPDPLSLPGPSSRRPSTPPRVLQSQVARRASNSRQTAPRPRIQSWIYTWEEQEGEQDEEGVK